MSHWPQSPVPDTTSSHGLSRRGVHHCCPVKLFLQRFCTKKSRVQGCPHPDTETAQPCSVWVCICVCVCDWAGDYLSPLTAATWASGRVPMKTDVKISQRHCVAFSLRFNTQRLLFWQPILRGHTVGQMQKGFSMENNGWPVVPIFHLYFRTAR